MTIKDIAREANVSPGTVDRVIHNRPGVSAKTKARIQEILNKHDFERNVMASTLAYKRKYHIAVLIPNHQSNTDFWFEPDKGVKSAIEEIKKYGVAVHRFYFEKLDRDSFQDNLNQILKLNPDGVVLAPFFYHTSLEFSQELTRRKIPFVFINLDIECDKCLSFIGQNSYRGGFAAAKLLNLTLNDQAKIAVIKSRNVDNHHAIQARVKGFMDYFSSQKISGRSFKEIFFDEFSQVESSKVLGKEFSKNGLVQGIFVPSTMSFHVARYLKEHGLDHTHLVGFDAHTNNLKYLKTGTIDFLIDQDPLEQGYMGVKVMFEYLLFKKRPRRIYSSAINIVTQENSDSFRNPKATEEVA